MVGFCYALGIRCCKEADEALLGDDHKGKVEVGQVVVNMAGK